MGIQDSNLPISTYLQALFITSSFIDFFSLVKPTLGRHAVIPQKLTWKVIFSG